MVWLLETGPLPVKRHSIVTVTKFHPWNPYFYFSKTCSDLWCVRAAHARWISEYSSQGPILFHVDPGYLPVIMLRRTYNSLPKSFHVAQLFLATRCDPSLYCRLMKLRITSRYRAAHSAGISVREANSAVR